MFTKLDGAQHWDGAIVFPNGHIVQLALPGDDVMENAGVYGHNLPGGFVRRSAYAHDRPAEA